MFTLLRQEFMKAWKQNRVYYWFILALIVPIVFIWHAPGAAEVAVLGGGVTVANLELIVVTAIIFTQEFRFGTIRPLLSRRFSRGMVFSSKVLTFAILYLVTILAAFIGTMIAWPIFVHDVPSETIKLVWQTMGTNVVTSVVEYAFFTSLILLVANIVKSSGAAIGLGMVMIVGTSILSGIATTLVQMWEPLKWNPFTLDNVVNAYGSYGANGTYYKTVVQQVMGTDPWVVFLVFGLYIIVLYLIAFLIFKRRSV
ncbi:ABC transporter permease [Eupransor demetentiae]|uniref:Permease component (NosY) n=1 Tax=Eupransor demetentiae TaxID=3109584 RepID=A0ABM9N545_9LACO|nr:ABC-type transport system involved in multi-copper enzyme maturation [Lactobacillaceae bacterium LMG 33000]